MKYLILFPLFFVLGWPLPKFEAQAPFFVEGTVLDAQDGSPLAGVSVVVKGQNNGTVTDIQGWFRLEVPAENTTLTCSFIGYTTQEVKVKSTDKKLTIKLVADTQVLSEVVVSKYKTEKKMQEERARKAAPAAGMPMPSHTGIIGDYYHPALADEPAHNTEEYDVVQENIFHSPRVQPLSTFSIDVDAASYSNLRRMLNSGITPPKDAVRIEEMVNYFDYDYPDPKGEHPFSISTEIAPAPWNPKHQLVLVGLQGKKVDYSELAPSNLVFLVDVSGSMSDPNKLPLLKKSLKLLLGNLSARDRVSLVVYAGAAGVVLEPTPANEREQIESALERLEAGGSTAGAQGIELAYKLAEKHLVKGGNNRVILCTDGDFNIGTSSTSDLVRMIEEKRKTGIYLTIAGFGMGNYKDGRMEQISNAGNGNYYYIDNLREAEKVFVTDMRGTLFTIAKDVKIQVEFNPAKVAGYRLIGYENRTMKAEEFNDDKKDAGELGAGHRVTALYEVIPVGVESEYIKNVDKLKYQTPATNAAAPTDELLTVKFRYKRPAEETSRLIEQPLRDKGTSLAKTSENFRWAASVAAFGMVLRDSEFKGSANHALVLELAEAAKGKDEMGYRAEFINMVKTSRIAGK